jgi:hypothetical protein
MTDTKAASAFFLRWLDRLSPPARVAARPDSLRDERDALVRAVLRLIPPEAEGWVARLTDDLDIHATTRAWPMVAEVVAAAKRIAAPADAGAPRGDDWAPDPVQVAADAMRQSKPVAETWLYGPGARELEARCMVPSTTMSAYRSSLFYAMRRIWGEDAARSKEAELRAMHAAASRPTTSADLEAAREARPRKMPTARPATPKAHLAESEVSEGQARKHPSETPESRDWRILRERLAKAE